MDLFIDYNYYINTYNGSQIKDERVFLRLARKSEKMVNHHTSNRVKALKEHAIIEQVKTTICELTELQIWRPNIGDGVEIANLISKNLGHTGLIYRAI